MPTGPDVPSAAMLTQIAADYGIDLTAAEADSYRSLMAGAINSYRRLEEFAEPKPDAKHRRDGGWQPKSEDNPCNGWYWRCNIEGAASGLLQGQRVAVKDVVSVAEFRADDGQDLLDVFRVGTVGELVLPPLRVLLPGVVLARLAHLASMRARNSPV